MRLAEQGRVREFWDSRLESGDPIAQLALDILDNEGLGAAANERLVDFAEDRGLSLSLEDVSKEIAKAHAKSTKLDQDGLLTAQRIAEYHHEVFEDLGLPARAFGGTPVFGLLWEADYNFGVVLGHEYWCAGCPEE